jgi:UDP-N-acetylglucosamine 2-epimerase (non-hydrolysing)
VNKTNRSKALLVFGTRPEAIKMAPVIKKLQCQMDVVICITAQHRELLDQVLDLFEIIPDFDLDIMKPKQDLFDVTSNVLLGVKKVLFKVEPDLVLVHGDTTTAMAASIAAFYLKIPIGQVEAGLRTHNIKSPFPEEFNRQLVTRLAEYHFAPTNKAKQNLLNEGVPEKNIYLTGNTVIDALFSVINKAKAINFSKNFLTMMPFMASKKNLPRIILVTGHRRENFGQGFEEICLALKSIAIQNPKVQIIYPVHLNPNVQEPVVRILSDIKNVNLIEPLDYLLFIKLMDVSYIILTDSGGIQEEAPSLGKPVILMRDSTERQEALEAQTVKLVGSNKEKIIDSVNSLLNNDFEYKKMAKAHNPYGDGDASEKICRALERDFDAS